ncbi:hypothetical protein EK904_013947 [Melospiza melodia maxima]|nr:hypothetical protein EK904_013947 [Melospiza melodia maxima]
MESIDTSPALTQSPLSQVLIQRADDTSPWESCWHHGADALLGQPWEEPGQNPYSLEALNLSSHLPL